MRDQWSNDVNNYVLILTYCVLYVSKASCTTWKRVLLQAIRPMKADQAEEMLIKHIVHGHLADPFLEKTSHFTLEDVMHFNYTSDLRRLIPQCIMSSEASNYWNIGDIIGGVG